MNERDKEKVECIRRKVGEEKVVCMRHTGREENAEGKKKANRRYMRVRGSRGSVRGRDRYNCSV